MLTLPADPRAVRESRAFVRTELGPHLDDDALAVAVLLVSELVTNAVVHAASEIQLLWDADGAEVTVGVRDADTGVLQGRRPRAAGDATSSDATPGGAGEQVAGEPPAAELAEGGRGLLIVDRLARSWGTEHDAGRKTVWFRLPAATGPASGPAPGPASGAATGPATGLAEVTDLAVVAGRPAVTRPGEAPGVAAAPDRDRRPAALEVAQRRMRDLLLPEAVSRVLPFHQHVAEVLARITDAVGAVGGEVRSAADETLARYGGTGTGPPRRFPLGLGGRPLGALLVHLRDGQAPDAEALAFLRIAAERLSLLAREHGLLSADLGRSDEQDFLSQATEMLTTTLSVRTSLTLLTQLTVPRLGDWCVAYLADERRRLTRVSTNHVDEAAVEGLGGRIDRDAPLLAALREAVGSGRTGRLPATTDRDACVVLPITSRTRTLAVVVVGESGGPATTSAAALTELGRRAALALDNARLHEEQADVATALQAALLPPALPHLDGVDLAARYHSASPGLAVGGDFYDAFVLADGSLVCAVGDACGKGAEAASVTGMSRDLIRLLLRDGRTLPGTLQRLNRSLLEDGVNSRFCTVALARLVQDGDEFRVSICLAGHPEPVLLRAGGGVEVVGTPGDLLGVLPDGIAVTERTVRLEPGDTLVLYTDGVSERRDGARMFGLAGIRHTLRAAAGGDAATVAAALERAARSFADSDLRDDLAILALQRRTA